MTTLDRLGMAALAPILGLAIAGAPLSVASAHDGRGHHRHYDRGHHYGHDRHYGYAPYRHYGYAPVRYVYVRRPAYTRVIYDDYYRYYPRSYAYSSYRYARPGVSISVGYRDGPYYAGYGRYYPYY